MVCIMGQVIRYFRIICIGTLPSFGYSAIANNLRGMGDSRTEFYFLMVSSVLNIILDFILVKIMSSVAGAAIATVISQTIAFVGFYIYVNKKRNVFIIRMTHLTNYRRILFIFWNDAMFKWNIVRLRKK